MRSVEAQSVGRARVLVLCAMLWTGVAAAAGPEASAEDSLREQAERMLNTVRQRIADCSGAPHQVALATGGDPSATDASPATARPALRWSPQLADAAARHAGAMARTRLFAHVGADGTTVRERVDATGYRWQAVAENLAAGQGGLGEALGDWLASATHCATLIDARYTEFGLARSRAQHPQDAYGIYWTLVLGRPR